MLLNFKLSHDSLWDGLTSILEIQKVKREN